MERLLQIFREYPVVAGVGFFLLVSTFLALLLGSAMRRSGASLKPLVFFFGFVAIIGVPQASVHFLDAWAHARQSSGPDARAASPASSPSPKGGTLKPVPWERVFGPRADPDLISDAKRGLAEILATASVAKLSFDRNGDSALAARFGSEADAAQALNRYGTFFQFAEVSGSDEQGWTARRAGGQGEWTHVVAAGNELYAWSGASRERVVANRVRALGAITAPGKTARPANPAPRQQVSSRLVGNPLAMSVFVVLNLIMAVGWFFKASSWAGRVTPNRGTQPLDASSLRARLLASTREETPTVVRLLPDDQTVEVTWRYADAKWLDAMRANRMRRVHRLRLELDERRHQVRVREYWAALDGSASPGELQLKWQAAAGMQFFQVEHRKEYGVQVDDHNRPTGALSTGYHFDLQELKAPIISAITESGWSWQPVMWNTPDSLRPLTE